MVAAILARIAGCPYAVALGAVAKTYLPAILFFVLLLLMGYDFRFDSAYPYQARFVLFGLGLTGCLQTILLLSAQREASRGTQKSPVVGIAPPSPQTLSLGSGHQCPRLEKKHAA